MDCALVRISCFSRLSVIILEKSGYTMHRDNNCIAQAPGIDEVKSEY